MKLKLNFNVDAAKQLLIQHGEKAAFALAVLVLAWFFWQTVQLEVLPAENQPEPLKKLAADADQHILTSVWDAKAKGIEVVDYPARAEHRPLQALDYPLIATLSRPLWEMHGKRQAPELLPVEELVAASGQCFLNVKKDAEGGAESKSTNSKGFSYVAVTGLVPLREEIAAYDEVFLPAAGYDQHADRPVYAGLKIERAQVTAANPNQLDWQEIDLASVAEFMRSWAGADKGSSEVVEQQYVEPSLTMQLPGLLGKPWDPAVVGHDKIPVAGHLDPKEKPEAEAPAAPKDSVIGFGGAAPGGASGTKPVVSRPQTVAASASKVDRKLLRFIDYRVEPGKQYRYRVKLLLLNPNYKKPERELKEPTLGESRTIETAWSEPTQAVLVPRGISILAGPIVKPTDRASRDPDAWICVITFDRGRGGEPADKKQVQRGVLANFIESSLWVASPGRGAPAKWEKVDLQSNALVVDIQGGRKLSTKDKQLVEPVEILVLDADGKLSVRDELSDAGEYHSRLDPLDSPKDSSSSPKASAVGDDTNPYSPTKSLPTKTRKKKPATP